MAEARVCPNCNEPFLPKKKHQKLCSPRCSDEHRSKASALRHQKELEGLRAEVMRAMGTHDVVMGNGTVRVGKEWDRKFLLNGAPATPYTVAPTPHSQPIAPEAVTPVDSENPFPEAGFSSWAPPGPPVEVDTVGRDEKILFIPDIHCGDQDDRAVALMLGVLRHFQPDRVIQLGDCLDFYGLSRFDKNPLRFAARIQVELDIQHELYRTIREISPRHAVLQQILGNHEQRGIRFLWSNPAVADLRALQLPELMRLSELGWEPKVHESLSLANGSFIVRHGSYIRRWGGYSAKAELDSTLISGISGHTHRQALYPLSTPAGELVWCEAGNLQKNPPEWQTSFQNWQQGVVLGHFERNGNSFSLEPVRFRHSYKCRVGSTELSA